MYVVFLARSLKPSSIAGYLNVVKIMHDSQNLPNPLDSWELKAVKRGINRTLGSPPKQKLPITVNILHLLYKNVNMEVPQDKAFWSACVVAFFAFLRKSTLLPKSSSSYDIHKSLCIGDCNLSTDRRMVVLNIRHTKTIQFGQKILNIPIAAIPGSTLCPFAAISNMLGILKGHEILHSLPLFVYPTMDNSGLTYLTHSKFVHILKATLAKAGIDPSRYSGHSFRRGGCTYAFSLGLSPTLIKLRGDWKSNAYERYVHVDNNCQIKMAQLLGQSVHV